MSGGKCDYFDCVKNRRHFKSMSFHHFPNDENLSKTWIENSGNINLAFLSPKSLKKRMICGDHFEKCMFMNPSAKRLTLVPNAVPINMQLNIDKRTNDQPPVLHGQPSEIISTPVKTNRKLFADAVGHSGKNKSTISPGLSPSPSKFKVLTPKKRYMTNNFKNPNPSFMFGSPTLSSPGTKSWVSRLIDLPSPQEIKPKSYINTPESPRKIKIKNKQLREKCINLQRLLKRKRSVISYLKNKNEKSKETKKEKMEQVMQKFPFSSTYSKALVTMQVLHKNRKSWTKAEKKVALSLYYKSPSTYKYMRRSGIILPGESTVRRWLHSINFSTGFPAKYLNQIKLKVSDMTYDEKKCVILIDEVSIMKSIEYNKVLDEIEGFEDLGTMGRTDKLGSHALVIMVRGLYKNWKFPFSYFFTGSGIKGDDLVEIVKICVKNILDLDLLPCSIVCDQGTQNRRLFTLLKATKENPSAEICGKKLFLIYDMPHLLKSVRNNLLSGDFKIGNKIVSMKDIQKTYEIDSKNTTARAMTKITPTHLFPNPFQKMSCKLAVQLLSNSVSAAIKTCVGTGQLKSTTALNTSKFIDIIDKMFDSANSKNLNDPNPNRRPMSSKNFVVFDNLRKAQSLFKGVVKVCRKTNKSSTPPCFSGIVWTTTAILGLYEQEKLDMQDANLSKNFFLMTNRLTQDALENLFSVMRQKNGYNRNPTARTFRCCYGHICSYSLMKCLSTCTSNCEQDDSEFLTVDVLKDVPVDSNTSTETIEMPAENEHDETCDSDTSLTSYNVPNVSQTTLETCSVAYFSGYLAQKCFQKFQCKNCNLIKPNENLTDTNQLLIVNKTYDHVGTTQGLKAPSDELTNIVILCLEVFKKNFPEIKSKKKVLEQLQHVAERKINKHFSVIKTCKEHYLYLIELLFRTRIYKECKWINANIGKRDYQNVAKLRILENK